MKPRAVDLRTTPRVSIRMSAEVVAKINTEVRNTFADPEIKRSFLERQYFESIAGSPDDLARAIKADEPKWRKVIKDAKVKAE